MKTSLEWIKEYVPDLNVTAQEYTDAMTLSGSKVENFVRLDQDIEKIVVGKIIKVEQHPDADKLIVCQVDIGTGTIQIVTGAKNVGEGDVIPVVLDGGRVAGGHDGKKVSGGVKIKKGKLRGIESNGMMCSVEELGLTHEMVPDSPEDGVYIFKGDIALGSDAIEAMGLRDVVFEYEITSNRVDCFGVLGIAREAAATFNKEFKKPDIQFDTNDEDVNSYIAVEVKNTDLCPRFCARVVKNVTIAPSPKWLQKRLAASGIRPINNLVDITNYVMEEYGQPMHAYDLDKIAGGKIIVRNAENGEVFQTLDGQKRTLDDTMLMICDAEKAVGIAGVMGGENSKVTDDIKTVLFEAATFNGTNVRLTSKKVGLRTDASGKFEKGLDPENAIHAINRACELMVMLGAGEVVGGIVDVYPNPVQEKFIDFDVDKCNKTLGTNISEETMIGYFEKIELEYDKDSKKVKIPSFRQDLEGFADLVEEVARFYGYDNIPTSLPCGEATTGKLSYKLRIESIARQVAEQCGYSEAMNYSFESPKVFDKLRIPENDQFRSAVVISNPLGEDYSIMRTISLNGMLTSLATNYNRRNKAVKLYELANIYIPKQIPVTELPEERMQFTLGMYGNGDFYDIKGVVEELFEKVGLNKKITYQPKAGKPFLHPGRQAFIQYKGETYGYMGEIHPEVADNYSIGDRVYIAVIDMPKITEKATFDRKYEGIAKFPAVTRDISMVMKKEIFVSQVEDIISKKGGNLLEGYKLFDIYEGEQIKEDHKSVAYSVSFRAKDKTLSDAEVNQVMDKILKALEEIGIELRK